jgi:hypothetical protein
MLDTSILVGELNARDASTRLGALKLLMRKIESGELERPVTGDDINNHIHTIYSFSPYSPTKAVWLAYNAGLRTVGIVDHDSISGAKEFIEAGDIVGMPTTIGIECRADMSGTPLAGRRINNPDQDSIAYVVLHGIPHTKIAAVTEFFRPYQAFRNERNRKMTDNINAMLSNRGISIDFDRDVTTLSQDSRGGTITERHISLALAKKLIARYGKGNELVSFLRYELSLPMDAKTQKFLMDPGNQYYEYDLLGFIKSDFIGSFYIEAEKECPGVRDVIALAKRVGAVSAYAYLGDVTDSVTGDKRAQKFEDEYLDELFEVITTLGFNAVTYMPPRNTDAQLSRVRSLCERHGLFQISGVDINSPRQSFVCEELRQSQFEKLRDAAWALIGHERAATENPDGGMFAEKTVKAHPSLDERVRIFREIGLAAGRLSR